MKSLRKFFYWNHYNSSLSFELGYLPRLGIGFGFDDERGIQLSFGFLFQIWMSLQTHKIRNLIFNKKLYNRTLEFELWFNEGGAISINLFADEYSWKKGDWKWYIPIMDRIKGRAKVTKNIIEEMDIDIPMPERSYKAHVILADWFWKYKRWPWKLKVRRCEIELKEPIPLAGKGENSWDCGDNAIYSSTSGKVKNIPEAVGNFVGSLLNDRVRYGGWKDWKFERFIQYNI